MLKFQRLFKDLSELPNRKLDIIANCLTIASACISFFLANFVEEDDKRTRRELKHDPRLKQQYDKIFIPGHLDPRIHSLRGGRTEPFAFSHLCQLDDEEIFLLDIVCYSIFKSKRTFMNFCF